MATRTILCETNKYYNFFGQRMISHWKICKSIQLLIGVLVGFHYLCSSQRVWKKSWAWSRVNCGSVNEMSETTSPALYMWSKLCGRWSLQQPDLKSRWKRKWKSYSVFFLLQFVRLLYLKSALIVSGCPFPPQLMYINSTFQQVHSVSRPLKNTTAARKFVYRMREMWKKWASAQLKLQLMAKRDEMSFFFLPIVV